MIGIDTNVLVRFLVDDDPAQNSAAKKFLSSRDFENPVFVSAVTIAETVWVLTRRLNYPMSAVVGLLRDLLASDGLVMDHAGELDRILDGDAPPGADLADYLIVWSGIAAGCSHTVTFDRRAARSIQSMELLA